LRAEVDEFSGELADLTERFSKFQKREGMRAARSAKEKQQELIEEARQIIASQGAVSPPVEADNGPLAGKRHLYRQ